MPYNGTVANAHAKRNNGQWNDWGTYASKAVMAEAPMACSGAVAMR